MTDDKMHIETLAASKAGCSCTGLSGSPAGSWAAAKFREVMRHSE